MSSNDEAHEGTALFPNVKSKKPSLNSSSLHHRHSLEAMGVLSLLQLCLTHFKKFLKLILNQYIIIITYWQWEVIKKLRSSADNQIENDHKCKWLFCSIIKLLFTLIFIFVGVFIQLLTCFSRQNPYAHWMENQHDLNENNSNISYCKMMCDIDKNFFTGFLFPDAIILFLSLYVYLIEPVYTRIYKDNKTSLDILIDESKEEIWETKKGKYVKYSIIYIVCSFILSTIYIFEFGFGRNDVVIQSSLSSSLRSSNNGFKIPAIICSMLGFIAFDLLYIHVLMRYVNRCDFLIEYLEPIKSEFSQDPTNGRVVRFTANQQNKIKDASKFLRKLNDNALATETVIVIAGFTAFSCVINLTNTTDCTRINKDWQALAVILRLVLWLCIVLIPFYKAAEVNETSREVSVEVVVCSRDPQMVSEGVKYITSKARLIGISVQPWLPNALLLIIIFAVMLGSGIKYFHLL